MPGPSTCGQGLAEHSILPGELVELAAAMAADLEVHIRALDVTDPHSGQEQEIYYQLASQQREISARLLATANQMAAVRDLTMGRHHFSDGVNAQVREAFEKYVRVKQELLAQMWSNPTH